jgi:flagellar secretion chaperone FliS
MRQTNGAAAYREARVLGSTKEQLVVLLYEHLLTNLRRASVQIRTADVEGRGASLERASDVVFELLSALDVEAGGEIASRLAALYAYFIGEIGAIFREADAARLDRLIGLVVSLHESWSRAAETAAQQPESGGALP